MVIYRAPDSKATNSKDRYDQDLEKVNELCGSIDIDCTTVEQCTRLGRKPDDQSEQQTLLLLVTFDTINNADLMLKNLTKLKFSNENLRQLRVTPDRSLKERERKRSFLSSTGKKLDLRGIRGLHSHSERRPNSKGKETIKNPRRIDGHKREQFNVWFGNVDVLTTGKFLELKKTLLQQASALPHYIAITEAKPKNVILKWNPIWFKLGCYKLKDKNLEPEDKGRGMLLYIRGDIETKEVTHEFGFDAIQAYELFLPKDNIIFVSIYRSPSSPYEKNVKLNKILRANGGNREKHIVCGDTIFRDIDWDNCTTNHDENSKEHQFLEAIKDSFLEQPIDRPTWARGNREPSLLDLLLTDKSLEPNVEYTPPLGKGNHSLLKIKFNVWTKNRAKVRLNHSKGNILNCANHFEILNTTNPNH